MGTSTGGNSSDSRLHDPDAHFETDGVNLLPDDVTPEGVAAAWEAINDEAGMKEFTGGFEQTTKFASKAAKNLGLKLS